MSSPIPNADRDDLTARVGRLEVIAADTRADVAAIKATLPHLSTHAQVSDLNSGLKADIATFRTELKTEIAELRTELKTEIAELRTELKTEIAGLRTELKTEIAELRTELNTEIAGLRTELADSRTELKTEIGTFRTEVRREIGSIAGRFEQVEARFATMEASLIKWMVGSAIASVGALVACAGLAFTAARFLS